MSAGAQTTIDPFVGLGTHEVEPEQTELDDNWEDQLSPPEEGGDQPVQPHQARPFDTLSLADLRNLPDPGWLVEGMVPDDSFIMLYGPPAQAKSFLVLDWLLCASTGISFNGRKVTHGHVVYACGEGLRGLKKRIDAWIHRFPAQHHARIEELIAEHFHVIANPFGLTNSDESDRFVETCRYYNTVASALDTYSRMMTGADENKADSASLAVATLERARATTGGTVILVHHTNADGSKERGSNVPRGAASCTILVKKDEEELVQVSCTKMKEAVEFPDQYYSLAPAADSVFLKPVPRNAPTGGGYGFGR